MSTAEPAPPPYAQSSTQPSSSMSDEKQSPDRSLYINAFGKNWNDFSTRGKQLEISITTTSQVEKYRNVRPDPKKSNCTLYLINDDSDAKPVAETTYKWGPGRAPVIKLYNHDSHSNAEEEITVNSKNVVSRTTIFPSTHLGKFQWRYVSKSACCMKATSDIVFEQLSDANGKGTSAKEIARLVRTTETKLPGTRWNEGDGGLLQMGDAVAEMGDDLEVLVVASCLLMLKKEIDALLNNQVVLIS